MCIEGLNGTNMNTINEHFADPLLNSSLNGYNNNLHYSINELIVNTSGGIHEVIKGNLKRYTS